MKLIWVRKLKTSDYKWKNIIKVSYHKDTLLEQLGSSLPIGLDTILFKKGIHNTKWVQSSTSINSYDNDRKDYILQKCLQQWRTNLTIKTIAVVIKTHTITKIKTNNKTKEREGKKQWKRGEREER